VSYKPVTPSLLNRTAQRSFPQNASLASWRLKGLAILRIAFGCVWAIDAAFKWQPGFANNFTGYLTKAMAGQPPIVAAWIGFWLHIVSINPHLFAYLVAMGETCLAVGLLFGVLSNLTCVVGILLSFMIWSTAQGCGGPYGPGSTDIGVSIIYVLVFIGLFMGNAGLTFGIDRYLASRLRRWSFLASGPTREQERAIYGDHQISVDYVPLFVARDQQVRELVSSATTTTNSRLNAVKRQRLSRM